MHETQDSRPLTAQGYLTMGGVKGAPPTNYDDNIRLQRERTERIQQYTRDLKRLYAAMSNWEIRREHFWASSRNWPNRRKLGASLPAQCRIRLEANQGIFHGYSV
jgi:hypothetical protein